MSNVIRLNVRWKMLLTLLGTMLILFFIGLTTIVNANDVTYTQGQTVNNMGVNYPQTTYSGTQISFEDFSQTKNLFCVQHGTALPSRLSTTNPLKDATVDVGGLPMLKTSVTSGEQLRNPAYAYMQSMPDAQNPYTNTTSRTIATYTTGAERTLRPAEAYVLAHSKSTGVGVYPDYVQRALWEVLSYYGDSSSASVDTDNEETSVDVARADNLAQEAINYDKNVNAIQQFKDSHNGNTVVDLTDYDKITVSYNKDKSTILVGPFKIDYVRGVFVPSPDGQSEMVNSDGVVSYSEINGAKLYSDVAETQEITNWKFIFPDVVGDKRTALKEGDEKYRFPYPNEEFYIEINDTLNKNVNVISHLTWNYAEMKAEGTANDVSGTFENVDWIAKDNPIWGTKTVYARIL